MYMVHMVFHHTYSLEREDLSDEEVWESVEDEVRRLGREEAREGVRREE